MAKRVNLGIQGLRINETECEILAYIVNRAREQRGLGCDPVELSRRSLSVAVGRSAQTTLRSCAALEEKGLVSSDIRHAENGAQVANAYCATALGMEIARLYEETSSGNCTNKPAVQAV